MLAGGSAQTLAQEAPQERIAASRAMSAQFAGELKEALTREMAASGPLGAVDVCKALAPKIAAGAEARTGWQVARTSLKTRNPANAPDGWETEVLQAFAARRVAGEDPAKMETWAIVEEAGNKRFRYMKAIPTASLCLTCHGTNVDPDLRAHLDELYPDDAAVGYNEGDIRGAFTISQPM
jgi:hypothetical protein